MPPLTLKSGVVRHLLWCGFMVNISEKFYGQYPRQNYHSRPAVIIYFPTDQPQYSRETEIKWEWMKFTTCTLYHIGLSVYICTVRHKYHPLDTFDQRASILGRWWGRCWKINCRDAGWRVGWGSLVSLIDWLIGWFIYWFVDWFIYGWRDRCWKINCRTLVGVGWGSLVSLIDWLIGWFIDLLID